MMANSDVKAHALADMQQLEDVVAFKMKFYRRGWAHYELAKPRTFKLIPGDNVQQIVRRDYADMQNMIFGAYPSFDEIMDTLQALENEINRGESE